MYKKEDAWRSCVMVGLCAAYHDITQQKTHDFL